ncbi:CAAX amino terminal protease family protein' [Enterococcus faecium]|nr:CAAX amino terminal protease family protein' [Enterococcus faecium]
MVKYELLFPIFNFLTLRTKYCFHNLIGIKAYILFQERNLVIFLKGICPKSNFRRYVLVFIRTNKRELSLFILYFLFIGFQLGILPLALLSMVTNSDLIHSEFVVFAVNLCIPSIIGIILFRKEIIESFSYFKEKTWLRIASIFFWVGLIFLVDVFMQYILGPTNQSANQGYLLQLGKQTPLFLTLICFCFLWSDFRRTYFSSSFN